MDNNTLVFRNKHKELEFQLKKEIIEAGENILRVLGDNTVIVTKIDGELKIFTSSHCLVDALDFTITED